MVVYKTLKRTLENMMMGLRLTWSCLKSVVSSLTKLNLSLKVTVTLTSEACIHLGNKMLLTDIMVFVLLNVAVKCKM